MKKALFILFVFTCLNALAQGKITGLQEVTDDDGTYYYHDIPTDGTDLRIVRTSVQEPEKDPAIVPFLKKWSIVAKVEGEDIESVKFTLTSTSGGGIQGLGFTNTFIDNEPPYSAFGDENGIFETFFSDDPYFAIAATPYTEDNAQGAELQGATSSFSIISSDNEMGPTLQIIDKETNEVLVETTSEESKTVDYNLVKDKAVLLKFSKGTGIVNFRVKISKNNEEIRIPAPPLSSYDLLFAQYNFNLIFKSGNHTITTESNGRDRNSWLAGRRDISTSWNINFVDYSGAKTYIPDDNFEQALIDLGYDDVLDDYVATVRLEEVTDLSFYLLNITDLTGIEAMINLKSLAIEDELGTIAIDHLDLSENVNLETLAVVQSGLQSINLQNNTKLKELAILDNFLEEIDLSNNKELTELTWIGNQAETLELSELKKLTSLLLLSTHVEALDLSELTELVELRIGETQLEVLDVSGLTKLIKFNAQGSNLYCIQVNDQQDTGSWVKDDTATFSEDCSEPQTFIPDDNFEQALIDLGYDDVLDDYVWTSNINTITDLDLSNPDFNSSGIEDVTGLEAFIALENLNLTFNAFTEVDIKNLIRLKTLKLQDAKILTSLDLTDNIDLEYLDISFTKISNIDLSQNLALKTLYAHFTPLTQIDVSQNTALETLLVEGGTFTEIDLSNNSNLEDLTVAGGITEIDLSNNLLLKSTTISGNLSEINLAENIALEYLDIGYNELTSLDLTNNTALNFLNTTGNPLICIQVADLDLANQMESVYIDDAFFSVNCDDPSDALTFVPDDNFEQALIDLGHDDVLDDYVITEIINSVEILILKRKNIKDLTGLEAFISLRGLTYEDSTANNLDLTKLEKLKGLSLLVDEPIQNLNLAKNVLLGSLYLNGLKIDYLDLVNNTEIYELDLQNSSITQLDVSNQPDLSLLVLWNTPNLNCIQVSDVAKANSQEFWHKDDNDVYSEDCTALRTYVPDDNFEQALIDLGYDDVLDDYVLTNTIKTITTLDVERREISDLEGIKDFLGLIILKAPVNKLKELDLSQNTNLEVISLQHNSLADLILPTGIQLIELVVDNNTSLQSLDVSGQINLEVLLSGNTGLSDLNLNNNYSLRSLNIGGTDIKSIDLSQNKKLKTLGISRNFLLTEIDLSNNVELEVLNAHRAALKSLDLSANVNLTSLEADHMSALTSLNIKNGNNTKLNRLFVFDNDSLSCIQIDDLTFALNNPNWNKDDTASYSEDCSVTIEDSDNDGVTDKLDFCPNTPEGQSVNAQGCSLSQYADIAVQNVSIGLGSFLCSDPQNCTVDVAVLRDVDIQVSVVKDGNETIFDGMVGITNPLSLESLTAGEYRVCATRSDIPNFVQCYEVSSTSSTNSISTTIVIQNPGQVYTLSVEGNKKYEVLVNGSSTLYEFDSVEKQNIEIPLEVGSNAIQIVSEIECNGIVSVDVEEDNNIDNLLLFPTLSSGEITIENNTNSQIHGITVTGLNGITTKYIPINGNPEEIKINLLGAAKGMYIVRIQRAIGKPILKKILIR